MNYTRSCQISWSDASCHSAGSWWGGRGCDVPQSGPPTRGGEGLDPDGGCCSGLPHLTARLAPHPPLSLLLPSLVLCQGTQRRCCLLGICHHSIISWMLCVGVPVVSPGEGSGFRDCQSDHPVPTPEQLPGCWRHCCLCSELVRFVSITLFCNC